ncbi:hypothetical protein P8C59_005917 [Phyllachora maydis]|uniref:Probable cytosolic iron-sulfur protein assembly protein 1 n=1 Tax=Phyllachora maydis TaxID=1825666 RepID=A0AAD9I5G3_9PEZI|nr:hypothetical protein P8C59_005917 [Phyllachora maydis]
MAPAPGPAPPAPPARVRVIPLPPLQPDLYQRAWCSAPHPTLPLLATTHHKSTTVFSLVSRSAHSTLTKGHERSVRAVAWKPALQPGQLCLATASFDGTAALWRHKASDPAGRPRDLAVEITTTTTTAAAAGRAADRGYPDDDDDDDDDEWELSVVLEGHESEIKSLAFSPAGQFLATCSRDKSVWVWEDVGGAEADDEWETVAVLTEHDGDVKAVAWCPDVPGRARHRHRRRRAAAGDDVLASASYDDTARVWREDGDGEWVCVAVLEGHTGTVWGVQFEGRPRAGGRFPRLMTWSADRTIRIWELQEEEEEEEEEEEGGGGTGSTPWSAAGIPSTMARPQGEAWVCAAVLPGMHTRDVYSASWSAATGLVASTGGDGVIAVYGEFDGGGVEDTHAATGRATGRAATGTEWRVLETVELGHGPYEINHVTWCKRFDPESRDRGVEEMLVTTGDDGIVRLWQVLHD